MSEHGTQHEAQEFVPVAPSAEPTAQPVPAAPAAPQGSDGLATASIVLGSVSIVFLLLVPLLALILSGIGFGLGITSARRSKSEGRSDGRAKTGWIMSLVVCILSILSVFIGLLFMLFVILSDTGA